MIQAGSLSETCVGQGPGRVTCSPSMFICVQISKQNTDLPAFLANYQMLSEKRNFFFC